MKTTNYVRLDRLLFPDVYRSDSNFSEGVSVLKESKDAYIVATGSMVHTALEIAHRLEKKKMNIGVIDVYKIPINTDAFIKKIRKAIEANGEQFSARLMANGFGQMCFPGSGGSQEKDIFSPVHELAGSQFTNMGRI